MKESHAVRAITRTTRGDYISKVLPSGGGVGQRVGIQKQARGLHIIELHRITAYCKKSSVLVRMYVGRYLSLYATVRG